MIDPQVIAKRLREARETTKDESTALTEQLAIIDAVIDEYDEVINKLDNKLPGYIQPLNTRVQQVSNAYHARISHGCRNDLTWINVGSGRMNYFGGGEQDVIVYEVQKDPSTFRFLGFYGAKFYKFPKNRDYGANVVETIDKADANVGSTALILLDFDAESQAGLTTGVRSGIQTGDFITDDLDNPEIFLTGAGTSVVGTGLTDYAAYNYPVSGFCTTSDNKIYSDQKIGIITSFNIGDEVYGDQFKSGAGIIATGTTITGFGTAVGIVTIANDSGISTGVEVVLDFMTLSKPVTGTIDANIGTTFYVGMVSSYYFAELSAEPAVSGLGSSFIVIRQDTSDIIFDSSKNPIDPVEIGIAEGRNIGKGHKLELTNSGDPKIIAQWKEVQEEPEPLVGAGRVEYYVGNFQWPTITTRNSDGDVSSTHAVIGQRVIVGSGASVGTSIGYTGTPPSGAIPGDCGDYDTAIVTAENNLAEEIAQNVPIINHYINGADALRQLRNDDETQAWGLLQCLGYNTNKAARQLGQAEAIEDFDWEDGLR
mgnify:CR=1 FL=1|tara:strand:- start:133 stop:1749 length:1617 start_codon:yes stop_codon:yes gene_type:complete